jgi:hypothetical protein
MKRPALERDVGRCIIRGSTVSPASARRRFEPSSAMTVHSGSVLRRRTGLGMCACGSVSGAARRYPPDSHCPMVLTFTSCAQAACTATLARRSDHPCCVCMSLCSAELQVSRASVAARLPRVELRSACRQMLAHRISFGLTRVGSVVNRPALEGSRRLDSGCPTRLPCA